MIDRVGTTVELRKENRRKLLWLLLDKGTTTRNELKNLSGFSYTTIGNLLLDLQKENFILEEGEATSTGGRKAKFIKVNPDRAFFISIDISGKLYKWGLYNLDCELLFFDTYNYEDSKASYENFETLLKQINTYIRKESIHEEIEYIGVVIPGYYDECNDIITDSYDKANLESIKLKQTISDFFNYPVIIKNDAKTAAYNEKSLLENPTDNQLLYLLVLKESFGSAIVLNNKVYQGSRGYAGEIYPLVQIINGEEKNLGDLLYPLSDFNYISSKLNREINTDDFFNLYTNNDPIALELFEKTSLAMARGILQVSSVLNPSHIRIGGFYNQYGENLITNIHSYMKEFGEEWQYKNINLKLSTFTDQTLVKGIALQMISLWLNELWK